MRNSSWSNVRSCHRDTFGFNIDAKHETNDQMCKPDDIIASDINIQQDRNCTVSVLINVILEEDKKETDCIEYRPCLVHACWSIQIIIMLMPKVITSIYFDKVKIDKLNKVTIKELLLKNPKGEFWCKHRGVVCIF